MGHQVLPGPVAQVPCRGDGCLGGNGGSGLHVGPVDVS